MTGMRSRMDSPMRMRNLPKKLDANQPMMMKLKSAMKMPTPGRVSVKGSRFGRAGIVMLWKTKRSWYVSGKSLRALPSTADRKA